MLKFVGLRTKACSSEDKDSKMHKKVCHKKKTQI